MSAYETVLVALERVTGQAPAGGNGQRKSHCPAHADSSPSLSIKHRDGKVLLKCHAGCAVDDILVALQLTASDLFDDQRRAKDDRPSITATYDYVDETGQLLYQVVRMTPKTFRQRRPDGKGGWIWRLDDVRRPVYRLPEVLATIAAGGTVFVVEGEKDADAITRAGYVATCNSGGAGAWLDEHTRTLAGAEVIVIADRDNTGRRHAAAIAAALEGVASSVRCVEPAVGKDVADHLAAGRSLEELEVVDDRWAHFDDQADDVDPTQTVDDAMSAIQQMRSLLLRGDAIDSVSPPEPLVDGWLYRDSLAVLYGRSGAGKSFTAIDIACHIATGSWWQGSEVIEGDVLYVVAEGASGMSPRRRAWKKQNRYHGALDRLVFYPKAINLLDPLAAHALAEIAATLDPDQPPSLVIIDTLARSMPGGDENAGKDMGRVIEAADEIRRRTGACILFVHHSGKDAAAGSRGWSGLVGALHTELELTSGGGDGILTLKNTKQKEAREHEPIRLVLVEHDTGLLDRKGKAITSAAIAAHTGRSSTSDRLSSKALLTLESLQAIDIGTGATATEWLEVAVQKGVSKSGFYEHRKALLDAGRVQNVGTDQRPRYSLLTRADT